MNYEIEQMLSRYPNTSPGEARHALKEIIQELALQALSRTDFFDHALLFGGTALRIFHGLDRFSEDMDFSLQKRDPQFSLEKYLPAVEENLASYGFEMSAEYKGKTHTSAVQSAFLKGNTQIHLVRFTSAQSPISGVPNNELLKIKLEIDTDPPDGAVFEPAYRLVPQPYAVLLYDRPSLFAGKIHALLCRNWRKREKGRDVYDYLWYLSREIPVNLFHLQERMKQTGHVKHTESLTLEMVKNLLTERFRLLDISAVQQDVIPFLQQPEKVRIWSRDFLISVTRDSLKSV